MMSVKHMHAFAFVVVCLCSKALAFVARAPSSVTSAAGVTRRADHVPSLSYARRRPTRMLAKGFGNKPAKAKKDRSRIPAKSKACPCFSGKPYGECCKPFHDGDKKNPEPVEVMRARYAAFACAMPQYIMRSTHPDHKEYGKVGWREEIMVFCNNYRFTGLEVSEPETDPDNPGKVFVYFTAMMAGADSGGAVFFDERSVFLQKDEDWLYVAPDENYESSVDIVSMRKYNKTARTEKPKGATQP